MCESLSYPSNPTDLRLMRRALLAAGSAAERGEVPVGAVVARGEEVLAVATNEREAMNDPTGHALSPPPPPEGRLTANPPTTPPPTPASTTPSPSRRVSSKPKPPNCSE